MSLPEEVMNAPPKSQPSPEVNIDSGVLYLTYISSLYFSRGLLNPLWDAFAGGTCLISLHSVDLMIYCHLHFSFEKEVKGSIMVKCCMKF